MTDLTDLITDAARRLEVDLQVNADEFRAYSAGIIAQVATAVGQPGYLEAVEAGRDMIAIQLALEAVEMADRADAELRGLIFGFIAAAASAR